MTDTGELERRIEAHLRTTLDYEVVTFVRTPVEVAAIAARQPFGAKEGSLQYGLVATPLGGVAEAALAALATQVDLLAHEGREIAWLRPDPAATKLTNRHIERAIGMPATFRNATTMHRLAVKYGG